jgi:hypothetical protein
MKRHCEAVGRGNPARRVFGARYHLQSGLTRVLRRYALSRLSRCARMPRRLRILAITSALLTLNACILVNDFNAAWSEAKTDSCLSKLGESLYYSELRRDPTGKDMNELVRGWKFAGQNFMLLKKNTDDAGGRLYRFTVVHGIFQRYRLNPAMRATFKKDYPHATLRLSEDTVTLDILDTPTRKLLAEIVNKPEYWEIEDQTLYNPLRNPACLFEDRKGKELKG